MNPIDFVFSILGKHMTMTPDEYAGTQIALKEQYDNSDNAIKKFFTKYPWVLLLLPFLIPIAQRGFSALMAKIAPDKDGDGEAGEMEDLILALSEKIMSKRSQA